MLADSSFTQTLRSMKSQFYLTYYHLKLGCLSLALLVLKSMKMGLYIHVRWKGLSSKEDTLEPLQKVYEDVPKMVPKNY